MRLEQPSQLSKSVSVPVERCTSAMNHLKWHTIYMRGHESRQLVEDKIFQVQKSQMLLQPSSAMCDDLHHLRYKVLVGRDPIVPDLYKVAENDRNEGV